MTPAEEDAIAIKFSHDFRDMEEYDAIRLAIRAAYAQGREDAAKVCEEWRAGLDNRTMQGEGWAAAECAAAIRRGE